MYYDTNRSISDKTQEGDTFTSGTPPRTGGIRSLLENTNPARLRLVAEGMSSFSAVLSDESSHLSKISSRRFSSRSWNSTRGHWKQEAFRRGYSRRNASEMDHQRQPADHVHTCMIDMAVTQERDGTRSKWNISESGGNLFCWVSSARFLVFIFTSVCPMISESPPSRSIKRGGESFWPFVHCSMILRLLFASYRLMRGPGNLHAYLPNGQPWIRRRRGHLHDILASFCRFVI